VTCEEIRDLLPGYALGILDTDDSVAAEEHLAGCRDHDVELTELRATSFALELLRDHSEVSPALRESIVAIPAASSGPPAAPSRRWWIPAAAVIAVVAVFGAGWFANAYLEDTESPRTIELRYAYTLQGTDGELVRFSGFEGDDQVTVIMAGLERLEGGRLYRLWAIRGGEWLPIGQCNTNEEGGWAGDFAFALNPSDEVAVTIELPAADPQPRAEPILRSNASS
jgi:hypothetical protein